MHSYQHHASCKHRQCVISLLCVSALQTSDKLMPKVDFVKEHGFWGRVWRREFRNIIWQLCFCGLNNCNNFPSYNVQLSVSSKLQWVQSLKEPFVLANKNSHPHVEVQKTQMKCRFTAVQHPGISSIQGYGWRHPPEIAQIQPKSISRDPQSFQLQLYSLDK